MKHNIIEIITILVGTAITASWLLIFLFVLAQFLGLAHAMFVWLQ